MQFYRIVDSTHVELEVERSVPDGASLAGDPGLVDNVLLLAANGEVRQATFSSPTRFQIGAINTAGTTHQVKLAGNIAYLADGTGGLRIVDVTNPAAPVSKGSLASADVRTVDSGGSIVVMGSGGSVAGALTLVDVKNPTAPVQLDTKVMPGGAGVLDLEMRSAMVYAAAGTAGLILQELNASGNAFNTLTPKVISITFRLGYRRDVVWFLCLSFLWHCGLAYL